MSIRMSVRMFLAGRLQARLGPGVEGVPGAFECGPRVYSYSLYSYGLHSHGLHSYGLYSYAYIVMAYIVIALIAMALVVLRVFQELCNADRGRACQGASTCVWTCVPQHCTAGTVSSGTLPTGTVPAGTLPQHCTPALYPCILPLHLAKKLIVRI